MKVDYLALLRGSKIFCALRLADFDTGLPNLYYITRLVEWFLNISPVGMEINYQKI